MSMGSHSDGVEETFETLTRAGIAGAARVAEAVARLRTQLQQRAAQGSAEQARMLQSQLDAQLRLAKASLRDVEHDRWWAAAKPADVETAYRTAAIWRDADPQVARAYDTITARLSEGADVDSPAPDAVVVDGQLADTLAKVVVDLERRAEVDLAETTVLLAAADRADRAAAQATGAPAADAAQTPDLIDSPGLEQLLEGADDRQQQPATLDSPEAIQQRMDALSEASTAEQYGQLVWDSADRRQATADALNAVVDDHQAVEAKMTADLAHAAPATEATKSPRGQAARARRSRGTTIERMRGPGR